jgi:hypothetical protein
MKIRTATTLLALAAGLAVGAPPAHAAYVRQCVTADLWTFDPPITQNTTSGTVTYDYSLSCTRVTDQGQVYTEAYNASLPGSYSGNCLVIQMTSPYFVGTILAETAGYTFLVNPAFHVAGRVTFPNDPCGSTSQLSGAGAAVAAGV